MRRLATIMLVALALGGCEKLPGVSGPFAVGPLRFEMTVAEVTEALGEQRLELVAYDTALGEFWSVDRPFAGGGAAPEWLTSQVTAANLTFWDDKLVRVRLRLPGNLESARRWRQRMDRAYVFVADLSQGEKLFVEFDHDRMKVFLSQVENEIVLTYVDHPAYVAMDGSRQRQREQAGKNFSVGELRFGMSIGQAGTMLGEKGERIEFFAGLENRRFPAGEGGDAWVLGFAGDWGLSAMARLHDQAWSNERVREHIWGLQKRYGHGETSYDGEGYTFSVGVARLTMTLAVAGCEADKCRVSEGWLWSGSPEL
jgi:hypothetical protein